ncbi:MAG: response regulator transcription factor [Elainellaceae cyanobacterium]
MKILLVEDDKRIAKPLAKDLRYQCHTVDVVHDGIDGWDYAQATEYDLILLDLMLPRLDGISLCKRLRAARSNALILMLTAKDTTSDKIIGLDAGADDYLVKPFKLDELAARIRALSRRSRESIPLVLEHGHLCLNPATQCATYQGKELSLTPKEYVVLEYFMRHPGLVLTQASLLEKLWDFDQESGVGTLRTHLNNLRNKLKSAGSLENMIETVYGVGYRFRTSQD